jgi:hypothetical protein
MLSPGLQPAIGAVLVVDVEILSLEIKRLGSVVGTFEIRCCPGALS